MQIRHAKRDDLEAIVAIYNQSIPGGLATADFRPVTLESRIGWFEAHESTRRPLWVAEIDDGITGWLSFRSFYGRPAYEPTVEVGLYVASEYQGKGIGRVLLQYAIEQAPRVGVQTLMAFAFSHNVPSLKLFESLGFIRWGCLPRIAHMPDGRRDLILLGLELHRTS